MAFITEWSLHLMLAQITSSALRSLRFPQAAAGMSSTELLWIVLFGIGLVVLGLLVGALMRKGPAGYRRKFTRRQLYQTLSELNLEDEDLGVLRQLAGGNSSSRLMPLLQSKIVFEDSVALYRTQNPEDPLLRRTPRLRQLLNYGFGNPRNTFNDTRMLPPGLTVRVRIQTGEREVSFVSRVMAVLEHQWLIRAPTAQGKPVNLQRAGELILRASRENDAEYEFKTRVLSQSTGAVHTAALSHTSSIQRLQFRSTKRIHTAITAKFHVMSDTFGATPRRSSLPRSQNANYLFMGRIHDLSSGGALVQVQRGQRLPEEGQVLLFVLPEATIDEDIVAQLVRTSSSGEQIMNLHLEFIGLPEHNRLKLNRYLETIKAQQIA